MTTARTRRGFVRDTAVLAGGALAAGTLLGGTTARAATDPPRRHASRLVRGDVVVAMRKAAGYYVARPPADGDDTDWSNATFHSGNMALYRLTRESEWRDYTLAWATAHDFALLADSASQPFNANYECAAQAYLDLYETDPRPDPHYLAATVDRLDAQVASGRSDYWTWVDALHMAMPVFARFAVLPEGAFAARARAARGDSYLSAMRAMYDVTRSKDGGPGLYDTARRLWWRDATFLGTDTYWSRGNGWAIAALVKVLGALPAGSPCRAAIAADAHALATALLPLQRSDGFWNASLTQPTVDAGPETSGTAMHAFGLAWGVNHGLLDPAEFRPAIERAWHALVDVALQPDGLLGFVQGPGSEPSDNYPWTATDTAAYGVGAFLLAGAEIAALTG